MSEWLAHSPRQNPVVQAQTYLDHIANVSNRVSENASRLACFYKGDFSTLYDWMRAAALYHDLGKLDEQNQAILRCGDETGLAINHVDAGVKALLQIDLAESALLAHSHHRGIHSIPEEFAKAELFLRDPDIASYTESNLSKYLSRHAESGCSHPKTAEQPASDWTGVTRRIALSCLVDGDHGDTASHYGKEFPIHPVAPRWEERLASLDRFVSCLGKTKGRSKRNQLRNKIYEACKNADTGPSFYACDSPVGTGKTTAVMAHLLRAAIQKNLRHIIVVLPYTNIIKQSVEIYQRALVLEGENPEDVIGEHHHQSDFESVESRQLATLWKPPIIVTTAVQFFETIASNHPSKLRKLHELPGSAVFVDEAHASIPFHLWPQTWKWLKELCGKWSCHFVLASGSLPRFWELKDMMETPESLPELLPQRLREEALYAEAKRITPVRHPDRIDIHSLIDLVQSKPSPRLVIMNTVQSAAVIADTLAKQFYGTVYTIDIQTSPVLHLSTALAPIDRQKILNIVEKRLESPGNAGDFTLVATSCVEAGVDLSFRSAFRESAGAANLIQIGGRVKRNNERHGALLVDFRIDAPLINRHPAFAISSQILEKLFLENRFDTDSAADIVTEALRRELMSDTQERHRRLQRMEEELVYPEVAKLYKVIGSNTVLVLVNQDLERRLERGELVDPREINRNSVQIWKDKIETYCAHPLKRIPELYAWPQDMYDPHFLGYMKGVLPQIIVNASGAAFF